MSSKAERIASVTERKLITNNTIYQPSCKFDPLTVVEKSRSGSARMGLVFRQLELVTVEKVSDKGSFTKNVDTFEREGFISPLDREHLEPVLEFGHAAMHRNYVPKMTELITAL